MSGHKKVMFSRQAIDLDEGRRHQLKGDSQTVPNLQKKLHFPLDLEITYFLGRSIKLVMNNRSELFLTKKAKFYEHDFNPYYPCWR